jgi:esterase
MELYFRKTGSGMPLMILHGLYGSSDNWLSIGKSLADSFEVYLVDLRNHGRSPHDQVHNYEVIREDLLELIDKIGLNKVILAGHSMGGKAAICFTQHYPDRIEKLIVIDIAPKSYKDLYRNEPLNHYDILTAMNNIDLSSASSRRDVDEMLAEKIKSGRIRSFLMKNLGRSDNDKYEWKLNLEVLLRELDNIMDGVNENCFDTGHPVTDMPVLFIRGSNSPYILDEDMGFIKRIFPSAELETIPDAGHWLHAEQPAAFTGVFRKFSEQ